MSDEYAIDEMTVTGWLRTEIVGETLAGLPYVRDGRRALGQMRNIYGINERIAQGEAGGFYKNAIRKGDGTLIEVSSNDGSDMIRITVPSVEKVEFQQSASIEIGASQIVASIGRQESETSASVNGNEEELPRKKDSEEGVEEEFYNFTPYLWVGARIVEGGLYAISGELGVRIHLCVWEPGKNGEEPVILSNRRGIFNEAYTEEQYPLRDPFAFLPDQNGYSGIAYTENRTFQLSKNNVQEIPMLAPDDGETLWDEIVIADPDDDLGLGLKANISTSDYLVKVMIAGNECIDISPVTIELKIIVGKGENVEVATERFVINSFTLLNRGYYPKGFFVNPTPQAGYNTVADYGPNPHAAHWWQRMGIASIPHDQVGVDKKSAVYPFAGFTKEKALPPTGFEEGDFPSWEYVCPLSYSIGWGSQAVWFSFDSEGNISDPECAPGCQFKYTGEYSERSFFINNPEWYLSYRYGYVTCGEVDEGQFNEHNEGEPISFGAFIAEGADGAIYTPPLWGNAGVPTNGGIGPFLSTAYFSSSERTFTFLSGITEASEIFQGIADSEGRALVVMPFSTPFPCAV